jgi:nitroimidazol reductase NimA-like FMN-containing flavoprotein (pyridoxamine 5'-phosphate oxidase superfamily)
MSSTPRHLLSHPRPRPSSGADRAAIYRILDAGRIAHVAVALRGQPYVLPMRYVREGDALLLHGGTGGWPQRLLGSGIPACVSVALFDGLVLARAHCQHAMNYRAVTASGHVRRLDDAGEKAAALARLVEGLVAGRASEARPADVDELAATTVLRFAIEDASARIRSGPPSDAEPDRALPVWAGELPVHRGYGPARAAPDLAPGLPLPNSLRRLQSLAPA